MIAPTPARLAVVGVIVLALVVIAPTPAAAETVVVDGSGDGDHRTIGAALANASNDTTVRVREGVYTESVRIDESVAITAAGSVTLRGDYSGAGITIVEDAAPTITGIDVKQFRVGVDARETTGDWVVTGVSTDRVHVAVDARRSTGDWRVGGTRLTAASAGVTADGASGNWTVDGVAIRADWAVTARQTGGDWSVASARLHADGGIVAPESRGDWLVRNLTMASNGGVGIDAQGSTGDWRADDLTIRWATIAVDADRSTGDWAISDAVFGRIAYAGEAATLVRATDARGAWRISDSAFEDPRGYGIDARGASGGVAQNNWWGGPLGATGDQCVGAVDCSAPQRRPPDGVPRRWLVGIGAVIAVPVVGGLWLRRRIRR
ncbi:right-handed parallel beta-helix repeat-containing protein [Halococcoides cellulosivorans]|uniref:Pectinesterase n=1 Tax=Halococcoides cellulosivorans TaxID=1679096 RepID=A0A2R4WZ10_9EURY|nr:hypothetical protein [Halococcoides cellulosivorans]AWB26770.1 hypothetical protein HARCEL1_03090 [Halococcoides cellulosivorans]